MPRPSRVPADYFSFDDMNDIMDGIAVRRATASSAEPMLKPDYRAKRKPRPVRVKHERRVSRQSWECAE